ncbi:hypothetical protein PENARI_c005G09522 [Penicillium arizonense]|uniref:FAD/NAD(P)-binding domain-containing protein n=1 Tax=Penicillium arizonense TaxID=1835702 RepID=A0A1F5LPD3_PENAI|nr:hypothetical protein PENARI_c005G09522 [Penicillium arizonense]OGE54789.1 hypothetical protein PENARI_c005G09522 [Penicillium arizonense]
MPSNESASQGTGDLLLPNIPSHANRQLRVICAGAGASGIYLAYRLKKDFTDFTLDIYEKNADIGGTWLENRYPGCACDVPAHNYTYSFEPKWDWSANYAGSEEIYQYFSNFVDNYALREYISCRHEVVRAEWDEEKAEWIVHIKKGNGAIFFQRCDFFISAAGILNSWRWPAIPGLHSFNGTLLHSANWDQTVDLKGKHVGLIGNGFSHKFNQPTWVNPSMAGGGQVVYTEEEKRKYRDEKCTLLEMRKKSESLMTGAFPMFIRGSLTNAHATTHIKEEMRGKINDDALADKLIPNFSLGCRRFTPGINYLESLTLPNVKTVYGEITRVTPEGCVTDNNEEHSLDVLICATGFDTTFKPRFPVIGRNGKNLQDEWATDPESYLGIAAHGFPNYFMFLGPNCPVGVGPVLIVIEAQGTYFAEVLNRWQKQDIRALEPRKEAVRDFIDHKDQFMQNTTWTTNCQSWYKNPQTGKITALWPGSTLHYLQALSDIRYDDYCVTYLGGNRFSYLGNGFSQLELNPSADVAYYVRETDDGTSVLKGTMSTFNTKDGAAKLMTTRKFS